MSAIDLDYAMLHKAAQQMEKEGGSFAKHIAQAFYVADSTNMETLVRAFDSLFSEYYRKYRRAQIISIREDYENACDRPYTTGMFTNEGESK